MKTHDQNPKGNILLIFPDLDHPTKVFGTRVRPYGPPLGILYLATELTQLDYSVKVIDFSAEAYSADKLRSLLANTDVIGITALSYARNNFHELISEIHQFNPTLPIMIGGPDCNIKASFASMTDSVPRLPEGVDVMVLGEAEHTIVSVVDALMSEKHEIPPAPGFPPLGGQEGGFIEGGGRQRQSREEKLAQCVGVIFRDRLTGKVRWGQPYQDFYDLELLSPPRFHRDVPPDFRLVNLKAYTLFGLKKCGVIAPIITSRGCPHKCAFCTRVAQRPPNFSFLLEKEKKSLIKRKEKFQKCSVTSVACGLIHHRQTSVVEEANKFYPHTLSVGLTNYRERSAESVLDEIQQLADAGFQVLYIVDDNFMVNERRVHAIMDGIIKRGVKMAILAQGRVHPCSEALYQKMKAAGVQLLSYGLESGNQDVLNFYRKGTTIEQAQRALELADKCGIFTHGNFILGAPIETREHIERTIRFAQELPLDAAFFSVLNYTYGSELWNIAHQKGLIEIYESDVYADKKRGLGQFSKQELERFCQKAHYQFYFRPTLWARYLSKLLRNPNRDFSKLLVRGFLRFSADMLSQRKK
ncbi:radical SAM protein [Candidatus Poribacteria bacterium]|nr:radical SAM protein [Candidatus Poribacteria bacterium]